MTVWSPSPGSFLSSLLRLGEGVAMDMGNDIIMISPPSLTYLQVELKRGKDQTMMVSWMCSPLEHALGRVKPENLWGYSITKWHGSHSHLQSLTWTSLTAAPHLQSLSWSLLSAEQRSRADGLSSQTLLSWVIKYTRRERNSSLSKAGSAIPPWLLLPWELSSSGEEPLEGVRFGTFSEPSIAKFGPNEVHARPILITTVRPNRANRIPSTVTIGPLQVFMLCDLSKPLLTRHKPKKWLEVCLSSN